MDLRKILSATAAAAMVVAPALANAGTRAADSMPSSLNKAAHSTPPDSVGPPGHDAEHHDGQGNGNNYGWFKEHEDNGQHKGWYKSRGAS